MAEFRYVTAAEWGMTWARPPIAEKLLDPECYVHHTAGNVPDDAFAAFRWSNAYAQNTKGYSALDYDILVHRDPRNGLITIGEGRGKWMSAATLDRNEQGEAIVLYGYFHPGHSLSRQPHPDELEGVAKGIVWGIQQGWIMENPTILGHRDNPAHPGATGCPGDYLYQYMGWIRARVAELMAPPPPPTPQPEPNPDPPLPIGDEQMRIVIAADSNGTYWAGNGITRFPISSLDVFSNYVVLGNSALTVVNTSGVAIKSTADVKSVGSNTIEALGRYVP